VSDDDRVRIAWDSSGATIPVGETFRQTSTDGGLTWNPPLPRVIFAIAPYLGGMRYNPDPSLDFGKSCRRTGSGINQGA